MSPPDTSFYCLFLLFQIINDLKHQSSCTFKMPPVSYCQIDSTILLPGYQVVHVSQFLWICTELYRFMLSTKLHERAFLLGAVGYI